MRWRISLRTFSCSSEPVVAVWPGRRTLTAMLVPRRLLSEVEAHGAEGHLGGLVGALAAEAEAEAGAGVLVGGGGRWALRIWPEAEVMMLPRPFSSMGWMKRLMTRRLPKTWVSNMRCQSLTSVSRTVTLPWVSW